MRSSQILRHLELRLVKLHVQHPCTSTPRPCVDTQVWMWRNELGVVGIYRYPQRVSSSHTSARVSARMLPVTCAVTHGHTHVVRNVPDTCRETHPRTHVPQHTQPSCVTTHRPLHVSPHA
ncbi:hypothetical protein F2Q70_00022204 [Brassica cretica]|uniref:Uncharacterized protein n=1 Tax=Brassica cretica TaxID=69181 RepID=A0A8S9GNE0_BRACR|nr:hypothetical protein F2Q70_00022204 [Brassica cretica]